MHKMLFQDEDSSGLFMTIAFPTEGERNPKSRQEQTGYRSLPIPRKTLRKRGTGNNPAPFTVPSSTPTAYSRGEGS